MTQCEVFDDRHSGKTDDLKNIDVIDIYGTSGNGSIAERSRKSLFYRGYRSIQPSAVPLPVVSVSYAVRKKDGAVSDS